MRRIAYGSIGGKMKMLFSMTKIMKRLGLIALAAIIEFPLLAGSG